MIDKKRVLVAEDDPDTRDGLLELFGAWGYEVEAAENGVAALDLVERFAPDVLGLDLRLPVKDGLEVLTHLKKRNLSSRTIVISGEGEISDAVRSMKLGAYDYLQKPVSCRV